MSAQSGRFLGGVLILESEFAGTSGFTANGAPKTFGYNFPDHIGLKRNWWLSQRWANPKAI